MENSGINLIEVTDSRDIIFIKIKLAVVVAPALVMPSFGESTKNWSFYFICVLGEILLNKCEFIKGHIEHVGHNIMQYGNTPAQSKFDMIKYWEQLESGKLLLSFIGIFFVEVRSIF